MTLHHCDEQAMTEMRGKTLSLSFLKKIKGLEGFFSFGSSQFKS